MAILVKKLTEAGSLVSGSESRQIRSGLVVLQEGEEMGEHETGGGEELIVFLDGTAEIFSAGETRKVRAPATALIPAHTRHGIKNMSDVPLKYVYVYVMALDAG
jgi:quercetin dioxygenase-like cupin family protein